MQNIFPSFAAPSFLVLLLVLPVLVIYSWRRVAGLGQLRGIIVLLFRTLITMLLILAAAEIQLVRKSDNLTVLFLLDQSLSIPANRRSAALDYVKKEVSRHCKPNDRAGLIVFGRDATIEVPPLDDKLAVGNNVESVVDAEFTNLAEAMKLAQATFPDGAGRRVVLVSDGNQNVGDAAEQAQVMAAAEIGIDVVPIRYHARREVAIERVMIPADVRRNQPFDVRIVAENFCQSEGDDSGEVPGHLVLSQIIDDQTQALSDEHVMLPPGKKVFTVRQKIDRPNFYTYEAKFLPDRVADDTMPQNNRATAFTHVVGKGQVLFVVDKDHRDQHDLLIDRLRRQGLEIAVRTTDQLFTSLAELQQYDSVVLANVARATNDDVSFSDEQIDMLVRNTQQMGAGLVMLGGPNSFGAGGWTGTALEKAMPVDFRIRNAKVVPTGALVMVIDKSGSMEGQKIAICKLAANEAAKTLSTHDYVGVVAFDVEAQWIVPLRHADNAAAIARGIGRLGAGGGTNMQPGILEAYHALQTAQASIKHVILLTDGDTLGTGYPDLAANMRQHGITVSCVAVGEDADQKLMQAIAEAGGGKFYFVKTPQAIPRIFQQEARRVSRPLVYEPSDGVGLELGKLGSLNEMLSGIESLPSIEGYVLTSKKENPLVETAIRGLKPAGEENSTVLAGWTYGLGRAVVFTSDAGARWTKSWTSLPVYDKLFGQMIRWSMRPSGTIGKFATTFEPRDTTIRVNITALDAEDEFLNFLTMTATAVGPDLKTPIAFDVEQIAPGRYVGSFPARTAGSYFVSINPGRGMAPIRAGVSVPYSDEFRDRGSNDPLLRQLAATVPKGGAAGLLIESDKPPTNSRQNEFEPLLAFDTFRHDLSQATSCQDMWHWFVLAACILYFVDILLRRVHVHFEWVAPLATRIYNVMRGHADLPAVRQFTERLRSRKAEVDEQLDQLHASARFDEGSNSQQNSTSQSDPIPDVAMPPAALPTLAGDPQTAEQSHTEETYTERLLRAKKKVWDERDS